MQITSFKAYTFRIALQDCQYKILLVVKEKLFACHLKWQGFKRILMGEAAAGRCHNVAKLVILKSFFNTQAIAKEATEKKKNKSYA